MKRNSGKKRWGRMTAAELAEATKEFDHPLSASRFRPATKADRERFERALRAGTRRVSEFDLDGELLRKARVYAKKKKLTMSQLVERGLRRELAVDD